mgnify:CR=1 FL=1
MPEDYTVQPGDCISSIAFERGFFWETIWNHPKNSDLKQKRQDPNILKEGDIVHIPDKEVKEESCATDQKHKFKVKGVPAKLKLRLMEPPRDEKSPEEDASASDESHLDDPVYEPKEVKDEPVKNTPYKIEIDGKVIQEGNTDGEGKVEIPLPPNAKAGRIVLRPGTEDERVMLLNLGGMDPISEISGVRKRLYNLGFPCQATGNEPGDDLTIAVRQFQENNGMKVTGTVDQQLKDKLKELHGS